MTSECPDDPLTLRILETTEGAAGNPSEPGKSPNSDHKSLPPAGKEDDGVVY